MSLTTLTSLTIRPTLTTLITLTILTPLATRNTRILLISRTDLKCVEARLRVAARLDAANALSKASPNALRLSAGRNSNSADPQVKLSVFFSSPFF